MGTKLQPVGILDVARAAGVSTATVSRVLSSPKQVAAATRERVLKVIAELDYSPNASAKSLRTLETRRILVLTPDLANPFVGPILRGIEQAAIAEGYSVLVGDMELEGGAHYGLMLPRREVDGVIVLSQTAPAVLRSWVKSSKRLGPVVTAFSPIEQPGISTVNINDRGAGSEAVRYLYRLGHRRIGVIAGPNVPQVEQRFLGVRDVAKREGMLKDLTIEHGGKFGIETGVACGSILFARSPRPTAIVCFSDELAIGAMESARRMGLSVPSDVSIIGFDDLPVSQYLSPALTTVAIPMADAGREAIRLLLGQLRGILLNRTSLVLPFELKVRASTAAVVSGAR